MGNDGVFLRTMGISCLRDAWTGDLKVLNNSTAIRYPKSDIWVFVSSVPEMSIMEYSRGYTQKGIYYMLRGKSLRKTTGKDSLWQEQMPETWGETWSG